MRSRSLRGTISGFTLLSGSGFASRGASGLTSLFQTTLRPTAGWIVVLATGLWTLPVRAETPDLKQIFPAGGQAGQNVSIEVTGSGLESARFIASHPGIRFEQEEENWTVQIADDVPPGLHDVVAWSDAGVSGPRRFLVSTLPQVIEEGDNATPETAQELAIPGVVWGKFDRAGDVDCYRFQAEAGASLSIECRTSSVDQQGEPVLTLIDPHGRELLHSPGHQPEPVLHMQLPEAGEYVIQVVERVYRSPGDAHAYRLAVTAGPRLIAAFPRALVRGEENRVTLYGYDLPDGEPVSISTPDGLQPALTKVETTIQAPERGEPGVGGLDPTGLFLEQVTYSLPGASGWCRFVLVDGPLTVEPEEESSAHESAPSVTLPTTIAGRFLTSRDVDWYRFSAEKEDEILINSFGQRLGTRMDLEIGIHDGEGKLLTTLSDQSDPKDWPGRVPFATLDAGGSWKAPADGEYLIAVRDLYGGSVFGIERSYLVSIGPPQPDFALVALHPDDKKPQGLSITPGGEAEVELLLWRFGGFDGPVTVGGMDLPEGLSIEEVEIEAGQFSATLTVKADEELTVPEGDPFVSLPLQAEAEIGEDRQQRPVRELSLIHPGSPPILRHTTGPRIAILSRPSE
jgi:hypothetical protein